MATINKRPSGKWQATVRRDGRSRSRTFSKRADAAKWAREGLRVVKPATVCRALGVMQQAVDTAMREWSVRIPSGNPFKQVRKPRIDNRRERRLQAGEWEALTREAVRCSNPLVRVALILALETGMRRGELLSMRWRDFDLQRCTVMLPQTKNGHARTVPLSPIAVETMRALPRTGDRVLPISDNAVRLAWERLREVVPTSRTVWRLCYAWSCLRYAASSMAPSPTWASRGVRSPRAECGLSAL
jgi:integrase